jgi:DNA repair exonuclease SbcCD ATPase subunit
MSVSTLSLARYEAALASMKSRYEQGRGQLSLLQSQRSTKAEALTQVKANIDLWRNVSALLTKVSDYARRQLVERIEETVTAALQTVLEDDGYQFRVEIRELAGKPSAEWRIVSPYAEGVELCTGVEDAHGGGLSDIVSLALRLALLELSRPRPEGPIILDEVGKHVSACYRENLAFFLKTYAQRTGRQIILVTHAEELAACGDVTYRVTQENGVSEVTRL